MIAGILRIKRLVTRGVGPVEGEPRCAVVDFWLHVWQRALSLLALPQAR
jgi:hypothetical protein